MVRRPSPRAYGELGPAHAAVSAWCDEAKASGKLLKGMGGNSHPRKDGKHMPNGHVWIYYETDRQLILGVMLDDGRRFSIDIGGPTNHEREADALIKSNDGKEILVSARVSGVAPN